MNNALQTSAAPALGRLPLSLILILVGLRQRGAPGPMISYIASLAAHLAGGFAELAGGILYLVARGAGDWSLVATLRRRRGMVAQAA